MALPILRRIRHVLFSTMVVAACVLGLGVGESRAAIFVSLPVVTAAGSNWLWTYTVRVDEFQTAYSNPLAFTTGAFFTIFDFKGYVAGSASYDTTESGGGTWTHTSQLLGPYPLTDQTDTADNPIYENISWSYSLGPAITDSNIGTFSAESTFGTNISQIDRYTAQAEDELGLTDNGGNTRVPGIPEPTSMMLLGSGLFGAAALARRRRQEEAAKK